MSEAAPSEWGRAPTLARHLLERAKEVEELVGDGFAPAREHVARLGEAASGLEKDSGEPLRARLEFLASAESLLAALESLPPAAASKIASSERHFTVRNRGQALVGEAALRQGVEAALKKLASSAGGEPAHTQRELLREWGGAPHSASGARYLLLLAGADGVVSDSFKAEAAAIALRRGGGWAESADPHPISRLGTTRGLWASGAPVEGAEPGDLVIDMTAGASPHISYETSGLFAPPASAAPVVEAGLTKGLVETYRTVKRSGGGISGGGEGLETAGSRVLITEDGKATYRRAGRALDPLTPPSHVANRRRAQWLAALASRGLWEPSANSEVPRASFRRRYADWEESGAGAKGVLAADAVIARAEEALAAGDKAGGLEDAETKAVEDGLSSEYFAAAARGVDMAASGRPRALAAALQREQALTAVAGFEDGRRTLVSRMRREDPSRPFRYRLARALEGKSARKRQVMKKEAFQPRVGQKLAYLLGGL